MNPTDPASQASSVVTSLFKGALTQTFQLLLIIVLVHYGAHIVTFLFSKLRGGLDYLKGEVNKLPLMMATQLDDKFFDLLAKATANQTNLNAAMANALADGNLSQDDLKKLVDGVWADFKANLGVADLWGFGQLLIQGFDPKKDGKDSVERALRARFDSNVFRAIGEAAHIVGERTLRRRELRSRVLAAPTGNP